MTAYRYKALAPDGTPRQGVLEAPGREEALRQLAEQGWPPILLEPERAAIPEASAAKAWRARRVSAVHIEDFTRSLSSLLTAGVPLSSALDILGRESPQPAAAAWKQIHDRVIDGVSLAEAMQRSPEIFPRVYTAMVEAGETGGFLDLVLAQIAEFQARERAWKSNLKVALVYPGVLLTLATGVLVFLLVFFIPRFQVLFEGFDAVLPWLTRSIVGASGFLRRHGWLVAAGLGLAGIGTYRRLKSASGRRAWEAFLLKTPTIGPLTGKIAVARFCRMLGTLLGAGVPLLQGLRVARRSLGYQTLTDLIAKASERVQQGDSLAAALRPCRELFPGSTIEMISVSEESGRLDKELVRLAADMESRIDRQLKTVVALAEPLMLFFIATFIGLIFIGMVLPIFTIQEYIR